MRNVIITLAVGKFSINTVSAGVLALTDDVLCRHLVKQLQPTFTVLNSLLHIILIRLLTRLLQDTSSGDSGVDFGADTTLTHQ